MVKLVSIAVIIFGVVLICLPLVHFESWRYAQQGEMIYMMSMIATIAMKMTGGLLVCTGMVTLTMSEIFKK